MTNPTKTLAAEDVTVVQHLPLNANFAFIDEDGDDYEIVKVDDLEDDSYI